MTSQGYMRLPQQKHTAEDVILYPTDSGITLNVTSHLQCYKNLHP